VWAVRSGALLFAIPCLMMCYCGQAAAIIVDPTIVSNTFYNSIPAPLFYPMLILATLAAIIASQAMVSATFSIVTQAMRLQYFPRLTVKHTDNIEFGQVYVPEINYFLMVMIIIVIVGYENATALGYAYGITVSLAFVVTSFMYSFVIFYNFNKHWIFGLAFFLVFGFVDVNFFAANLLKFTTGGWFSVTITLIITLILMIWRMGRSRVVKIQEDMSRPLSELFVVHQGEKVIDLNVSDIDSKLLICFSSSLDTVPAAFAHFIHRFPVRPRNLAFVTVVAVNVSFVEDKMEMSPFPDDPNVYRVIIKNGYAERPPSARTIAARIIREIDSLSERFRSLPPASDEEILAYVDPTFVVGRDRVTLKSNTGMFHQLWVHLFQILALVSRSPVGMLDVPPESLLEVGIQVPI